MSANKLTSGRLLAKNAVFNLIGQGAPMLVALFTIPLLIKGLGTDRFGVLTLAWMVIGYFSLFDLGLGRALTQLVAEKLGSGKEREIPEYTRTALVLMFFLGLLGSALLLVLSPWLVSDILKIPLPLRKETLDSFYILAFSIPLVVVTTGYRGVLEAHQKFAAVTMLRIPMGVLTFVGPLIALMFSKSLIPIIIVLIAGRALALGAHILFCLPLIPAVSSPSRILEPKVVRSLLRFGSWMTVSNIVGPLMVYLDRFMIGALLSVTAVAYYATPYEMVTKLLIVPTALMGVLFPAFATTFEQDPHRTKLLFRRGIRYIFLVLFPIILLVVVFAGEGLKWWLGTEYAQNSTRVLQYLAIGVFANSLAQVPFALIQGAGRSDVTAKLHLIELPLYLISVWFLIKFYGIEGAAVAWLVRVVCDTALLFVVVRRLYRPATTFSSSIVSSVVGVIVLLLIIMTVTNIYLNCTIFVVGLLLFGVISWKIVISSEERAYLSQILLTLSKMVTGAHPNA